MTTPVFKMTKYVVRVREGLGELQKKKNNKPVTAEELHHHLNSTGMGISLPSTSSTLSRLYKYGYVDRIPDPEKAQRKLYSNRAKKAPMRTDLIKRSRKSSNKKSEVASTDQILSMVTKFEDYKEALLQIKAILDQLDLD